MSTREEESRPEKRKSPEPSDDPEEEKPAKIPRIDLTATHDDNEREVWECLACEEPMSKIMGCPEEGCGTMLCIECVATMQEQRTDGKIPCPLPHKDGRDIVTYVRNPVAERMLRDVELACELCDMKVWLRGYRDHTTNTCKKRITVCPIVACDWSGTVEALEVHICDEGVRCRACSALVEEEDLELHVWSCPGLKSTDELDAVRHVAASTEVDLNQILISMCSQMNQCAPSVIQPILMPPGSEDSVTIHVCPDDSSMVDIALLLCYVTSFVWRNRENNAHLFEFVHDDEIMTALDPKKRFTLRYRGDVSEHFK